jgi:manganese/zinc/iron transport system permease protein
MIQLSSDTWIIITASLVAISCAIVGSLLLVKKMAMLGDAISHSVLLGIVTTVLLTGSRSWLMLVGAAVIGILTAATVEFLQKNSRLHSDASIGVVFTSMFALGVLLLSAYAGQVDLDTDCVLYGELALVPFDTLTINDSEIPRAALSLAVITLLVIFITTLFFNRLKLVTFDSEFGKTIGVRTSAWSYLIMTMASIVIVGSFEAVGSILVITLLVAPAATSFLFTRSLAALILLSSALGTLAAVLGVAAAATFQGSIAAAIALCGGGIFFVALAISIVLKALGTRRSHSTINPRKGAIKE